MTKTERRTLRQNLQQKAREHFTVRMGMYGTNAQIKAAAKKHVDQLFSQLKEKGLLNAVRS